MRPADEDVKPLVVPPKVGRKMVWCGHQKFYDLLNSGEIESYIDADGRSRKVLVSSIEDYIRRQVDAAKRRRLKDGMASEHRGGALKDETRAKGCNKGARPPGAAKRNKGLDKAKKGAWENVPPNPGADLDGSPAAPASGDE
jgi:hypothetical protein